MTSHNQPDFKNPNREPVIAVLAQARLDDGEVEEGYRRAAHVGLRWQVVF